jgi:hypothetical protein
MGSDLTEKQEAFAAYFVAGGGDGKAAAKAAGYAERHCAQEAYRLARNPAVQRLIRNEQQRVIGGRLCSQALGVLESIMLDPSAPAGARVDACKTILDRGGLPAIPANLIVQDAADKRALSEMSLEDVQAFIVEGRARLALMKANLEGEG